jgi:hypothetical protein
MGTVPQGNAKKWQNEHANSGSIATVAAGEREARDLASVVKERTSSAGQAWSLS